MEMKHYLIAGGAGFLGVNLSRYLLDLGHKISVWDNLSTGDHSNLPDEVLFTQVCITDFIEHSTGSFDGIFNLACPASPMHYQKDPIQTLTTCINGTHNLLKLATNQNIPLLQASTSEVYGDPDISPQPEEYNGSVNCTGIRSCYDEGKRAAEALCFDYNRTRSTKIKVVRIFNTYGPYMSPTDGRVISNFITQAIEDKDITVHGDGNQTRSFCYVDDMVKGLVAMMNSSDDVIGPINLGNPHEQTIADIAKQIVQVTNSSSNIVHKELPEDDPLQRCPDISKAKELLQWEPSVNFSEGVENTITYFASRLHVPVSTFSVGVIGGGFVGSATSQLRCERVNVMIYDNDKTRCVPPNTSLADLMNCDIILICVPTPSLPSGECDTSIVRYVIEDIKKYTPHPPIVVRSTVPPGTSDDCNVSFFPEFLREITWKEDFINTGMWYIGSDDKLAVVLLSRIISAAKQCNAIKCNNITVTTSGEAEMIKYMRNSFFATKVAFCNEIYDMCTHLNINYNIVREGFLADPRVGRSHTDVPGYTGKRGYGGHCLPKDTKALSYEFRTKGVPGEILDAVDRSNTRVKK
jgi:UDP-glucuronate decarboxylase